MQVYRGEEIYMKVYRETGICRFTEGKRYAGLLGGRSMQIFWVVCICR